jgi:hypothetical protein
MGNLNRGQIIDQAMQRVGNNSPSILLQARTTLQRLLNDLYQQWDWPFLWTTSPVTLLPSGILDLATLPLHFLKPEDDQSLALVTSSGERRPIQEIDHRSYAMRTTGGQGSSGTPRLWTINYGPAPTGLFTPRPAEALPAELRYKFLPATLPFAVGVTGTFDTDVPPFPWDSFLIDTLTEWGMSYEADPRRAEQITINEAMLQRLRGATYPERSFPSQVPLDPLFFTTPTWGSGRE